MGRLAAIRKALEKNHGMITAGSPSQKKLFSKQKGLDWPSVEAYADDPYQPGINDVENGFMMRPSDGAPYNLHVQGDDMNWSFHNETGDWTGRSIPKSANNDELAAEMLEEYKKRFPQSYKRNMENQMENLNQKVYGPMDWQRGRSGEEMLEQQGPGMLYTNMRQKMLQNLQKRDKDWEYMTKEGFMPTGPYKWELQNKKLYRR